MAPAPFPRLAPGVAPVLFSNPCFSFSPPCRGGSVAGAGAHCPPALEFSTPMKTDYLPILLQVLIAIGFAAGALIVSLVLGKATKRNKVKDTAYECGMIAEEGQPRFSVKFYLVAMLFILFDLEIVFMYPWAVIYKDAIVQNGPAIFWSMLSFVSILTLGYVYAVKKGALDWKS